MKRNLLISTALLCSAIILVGAQTGFAWPTYEEGCQTCHGSGFSGLTPDLHTLHAGQECTICHPGAAGATPIPSSNCIVCHPFADPGVCPLINATAHAAIQTACLSCHTDISGCQAPGTTTTTIEVTTTTTTSVQPTTTTTSVQPTTTTTSVQPTTTTTSVQPTTTTTSVQPTTTTTSVQPTTTTVPQTTTVPLTTTTTITPPEDTITICHIPPGINKSKGKVRPRTIIIPIENLDDHLAHGDSIGPCDEDDFKPNKRLPLKQTIKWRHLFRRY